ncbi:MAG: hypothetical protein ICV55_10175 [Coleofasciculus sp. C3-bin4]|nr:hypothetical protein [Coleofasciculus sp. C3-bin4]
MPFGGSVLPAAKQLFVMARLIQGHGDTEMGRRPERIQTGTQTPPEFKPLNLRFSRGLEPLGLASPRPRVPASPRLFDNVLLLVEN